jgi:hypothetical protein
MTHNIKGIRIFGCLGIYHPKTDKAKAKLSRILVASGLVLETVRTPYKKFDKKVAELY